MNFISQETAAETVALAPRDWVQILAQYRTPDTKRSLFELTVSLVPFIALWAVAWWALSIHPILALSIALMNGAFLVRIFCIQHDCGHSSFFHDRRVSDWVGRCLGVLTMTPYAIWRQTHALHHRGSGNLANRGIGDIVTLTLEEYNALPRWKKWVYQGYRSPFFLFGFVPAYLFFLQNRWPSGMTTQWKYWRSAILNNLALAAVIGLIIYFGGLEPIFWILMPTVLMAATLGMWLFYVQHQFEDTHWDHPEDWQVHEAALHGSSHYVLPRPLQWMSANIGIHHVHHLYARIPFYRLPEVVRDHPELGNAQILTLKESFANARLHIWDEAERKLLSFRQARAK